MSATSKQYYTQLDLIMSWAEGQTLQWLIELFDISQRGWHNYSLIAGLYEELKSFTVQLSKAKELIQAPICLNPSDPTELMEVPMQYRRYVHDPALISLTRRSFPNLTAAAIRIKSQGSESMERFSRVTRGVVKPEVQNTVDRLIEAYEAGCLSNTPWTVEALRQLGAADPEQHLELFGRELENAKRVEAERAARAERAGVSIQSHIMPANIEQNASIDSTPLP